MDAGGIAGEYCDVGRLEVVPGSEADTFAENVVRRIVDGVLQSLGADAPESGKVPLRLKFVC